MMESRNGRSGWRGWRAASGVGLAMAVLAGPTDPVAGPSVTCRGVEGHDMLDFWLGEWDVTVDGQPAGTNRIEKILDGCAVMEFWTGAGGDGGRSLFYRDGGVGVWKQVWVTGMATQPGGLKEKVMVEGAPPGAVRFQGTIRLPDGTTYLDRTTLSRVAAGRVRQVIEISVDGGETWQSRFDGLYTRTSGG